MTLLYPSGFQLLPEPVAFIDDIPLESLSFTPTLARVRYTVLFKPDAAAVDPFGYALQTQVLDSETFHTHEWWLRDVANLFPTMPMPFRAEVEIDHRLAPGTDGAIFSLWSFYQTTTIVSELTELVGVGPLLVAPDALSLSSGAIIASWGP